MESQFVNDVSKDLQAYGKTLSVYGRLRLIGGASRILGLLIMGIIAALMTVIILTFGAVAAIDALSYYMPVWGAALVMAGVFALIIVILVLLRKPLFINPFVRVMSAAFFEDDRRLMEEERLKKEVEDD